MAGIYKRRGSSKYMMTAMVNGKQECKSTRTSNKRLAQKRRDQWVTEIYEGRYHVVKTNPPTFEQWADQFLTTIPNLNTRARYSASLNNLKPKFGGLRLSHITADLFEEFKDERLAEGVGPATVNRDLAVSRRMLKLAERRRFIARSPFAEVDFLEERSKRRKPHIVSYDEENRILAVAAPHIKALTVLLLQTGMRPNREALALEWADVDFVTDTIWVRESKTAAGVRAIPISTGCKAELLAWRSRLGADFSKFVFPNMRSPGQHLTQIRRSWGKALHLAGIPYFWLYNLRHTFASRLSAAGVTNTFVAQMIGHSSSAIVQTYAKVIDEYHRDAIRKMEALRHAQCQAPTEEAREPTVQ